MAAKQFSSNQSLSKLNKHLLPYHVSGIILSSKGTAVIKVDATPASQRLLLKGSRRNCQSCVEGFVKIMPDFPAPPCCVRLHAVRRPPLHPLQGWIFPLLISETRLSKKKHETNFRLPLYALGAPWIPGLLAVSTSLLTLPSKLWTLH